MRAWPAPAQGLIASGFSGSITPPLNLSPLANFDTAIQLNGQQQFSYDGANSTGLRNGTNAQTFSIYNTYTAGTPDYERLELFWTANVAVIRTGNGGTGTARVLVLRYANTASSAVLVPAAITSTIDVANVSVATAVSTGRVNIARTVSVTATSGTHVDLGFSDNFNDAGTNSTTVVNAISISPTINYTGASRTGKVVLAYFNPTNTSLPTGQSAAISLSTTASSLGGLVLNNVADEDTNFEQLTLKASSNVWTLNTTKGGTGTVRSLAIATSGTARWTMDLNGKLVLAAAAVSSGTTANWAMTGAVNTGGAAPLFTITGGASTAQTLSTEINFINFNLAQTVQWATGALSLQRCVRIQATTLAFAGASTVTQAATLAIDGPPVAGTSATITQNPYALFIGSGDVMLAGSGSALATGAVTGFTWLPGMAGTPTGAPVGPTGAFPFVYDSTANKIWVRSGGTWRGVAVA